VAKKRASKRKAIAQRGAKSKSVHTDFEQVLSLIEDARARAVAAVNTELIDLYWAIGQHISRKIVQDGWGQGHSFRVLVDMQVDWR